MKLCWQHSILFLFFAIVPFSVATITRCYANLGCYDSSILHALPQDPAHVRTQFHISCRNYTDDVIIIATSDEDTIRKNVDASCFQVDRLTKIVIHGFNDAGSAQWVRDLRDVFLLKGDYNIISVDWQHGARFPYVQAVANSFMVAKQVANFIRHLERVHGLSPSLIHMVGHSLGAQIAGNAGADLSPTRVTRVTGLDPAEPYFDLVDDGKRLDKGDAIFVDVIHTDGETFTGLKGYGSLRPQGHVDIYPNGGLQQPGCDMSGVPGLFPDVHYDLQEKVACSHARAIFLFMQAVNSTDCQLSAHACTSWADFEKGNCSSCQTSSCVQIGADMQPSSGVRGQFYLATSHTSPYCGANLIVTIPLSPNQGHAYGRIFLVLGDVNGSSEAVDFSRSDRHYHSGDVETHMITASSELGELAEVKVMFVKGSGLSSLGTSDYLAVENVTITSDDHSKRWELCPSPSPDTTTSSGGPALSGFVEGTCP